MELRPGTRPSEVEFRGRCQRHKIVWMWSARGYRRSWPSILIELSCYKSQPLGQFTRAQGIDQSLQDLGYYIKLSLYKETTNVLLASHYIGNEINTESATKTGTMSATGHKTEIDSAIETAFKYRNRIVFESEYKMEMELDLKAKSGSEQKAECLLGTERGQCTLSNGRFSYGCTVVRCTGEYNRIIDAIDLPLLAEKCTVQRTRKKL
ncbi:hypothetical protein EVAR_57775_1 [Eumeta japonica]|uniref:Uncharacterized protein n=1 Tax=Eumeta variegata TaxID=151549 RepID=A0A4C1Y915_EUMVA|nr:hypothetical protein EVAR_57775_1 [Eumeta japonica]